MDACPPLRTESDSVEHNQKFIGPWEAHNELVHQIWAQSDQRFICKLLLLPDQSEARK